MADQVNPMGSMAPGLPSTIQVAVASQPAPEKPRVNRSPDSQPKGQGAERVDQAAQALDSAVKDFQAFFKQSSSDLMFQVDESSGRFYFKVVDSRTKEVIRQIPSEEVLATARKLREMANPKGAAGVLVDRVG